MIMKKFTSLLFALCVMLSAMAMPQDKALRAAFAERQTVQLKSFNKALKAQPMQKKQVRVKAVVNEDIEINFESPMSYTYYTSYNQWHIAADNGVYRLALDFEGDASSIAGTYADAAFDGPYCYLYDYATEKRIYKYTCSGIITEDNGRIDGEFLMADSLGNNYDIIVFYEDPTAESEEEFVADNLNISEQSFWGYTYIAITAGDEELGLSLTYWGDDFSGEIVYDGDDLSGSLIVDGAEVDIFSGSINVEITADGGYHVTGSLLGMNSVQYNLDLVYVLPDATRQEDITATVAFNNLIDSYGLYQLYGYNTDHSKYITLAIYADQVAGNFDKGDLYLNYSYIVEFVNGDTLFLDPLTADLTVAIDNSNNVVCTGTMRVQNYYDASDVVDYSISLTAPYEDEDTGLEYDQQEADFSADFATYALDDSYLEEYAALFAYAENDDAEYIELLFYLPAGSTGLVDGQYDINATYEPMTVQASSGVSNQSVTDSYAAFITEDGYLDAENIWFMVEGTVVVSGEVITVNAVNSYGRLIHAVMHAATAVENTTVNAAAQKRIVNGMLLIERNGETYNAQGIRQ